MTGASLEDKAQINREIREGKLGRPAPSGNGSAPAGDPSTEVVRLSEVESRRVEWLWYGRLPAGKVTVLDGDPGTGKSTLTLDLAARLTTATPLAIGGHRSPSEMWPSMAIYGATSVVLLNAEDDLEDTIRPRLEAAGADLDRVVAVPDPVDADGHERPLVLPGDIPTVESVVTAEGARLVVVDPLMAYLSGEVNSYRDQDVRRALRPLKGMAERTGAAVLVVRHLTKSAGRKAVYRGGGSIGIVGAARAGLAVARDPDDDDQRVLSVVKSNLAPEVESLVYRLQPVSGSHVARVDWIGTSTLSADELLAEDTDGGAGTEAEAFLASLLDGGPVPSSDVLAQADEAGIAEKTLRRAASRLNVDKRRQGFGPGGQWVWALTGESGTGDESDGSVTPLHPDHGGGA